MITTKLHTVARRWFDLPVPLAIAICLFCLLAIGGLVGRVRSAQQAAAQPTPGLIILIATQPAVIPPTAVPAAQVAAVLPRFVVCYDQPISGAVLGPIPAPDASAIVARYGDAWVMTPWNGGYCWLRAAEVGLPDVADLAPTDAPQVVYIAAQPAEAAPTPAAAAPVVEPAPVVWPTAGQVRAEDFAAPDQKASCAFTGCLR